MTLRQEAREAFAKAVADQGPAWANTANNIRAGFENVWIVPAIAALEAVLRLVPDETDDEIPSRPPPDAAWPYRS